MAPTPYLKRQNKVTEKISQKTISQKKYGPNAIPLKKLNSRWDNERSEICKPIHASLADENCFKVPLGRKLIHNNSQLLHVYKNHNQLKAVYYNPKRSTHTGLLQAKK